MWSTPDRRKAPVKRLGFSADDVKALSDAAEGHRLAGVFALILVGFRRGEALGVRWDDFDGAMVAVRRSRVWLGGGPTDGEPKTTRGKRTVLLAQRLGHDENVMRTVYGEPPTDQQQQVVEALYAGSR